MPGRVQLQVPNALGAGAVEQFGSGAVPPGQKIDWCGKKRFATVQHPHEVRPQVPLLDIIWLRQFFAQLLGPWLDGQLPANRAGLIERGGASGLWQRVPQNSSGVRRPGEACALAVLINV